MARADGRVRPGQNIATAFSARAWNRAQDAADLVLAKANGFVEAQSLQFDRAPTIVTIQNRAGQSVPRFGVLGIDRPVVNPADSDYSASVFSTRPVFECRLPTSIDSFVVCLEPLEQNAFGRAAIGGMFACKVKVNDQNHRFATALTNDVTQLQTTACGPVLLLWKDVVGLTDTTRNDRWAVGVM
jgi:hypothetical protein